MNRAPQTWLLPTALVAYVALAVLRAQSGFERWFVLVAPLFVAWGLRVLGRKLEAGQLATDAKGVRFAVIGLGLFGAANAGPVDNAALQAASGVAQCLLTASALICVARLTPPPGLLQGHPAASSRDALVITVVLWTATTCAAIARAVAPDRFPLSPIALDTAFVFSSLGSLLLLGASFLRTKLLRGVELGVGDRVQAALSLAIAGIFVGAGSGFVHLATADTVAGSTLAATCTAVVLALAAPSAARVTRFVRGFVALLLLGTPVTVLGAWFALKMDHHPAAVALTFSLMSMLVGLLARSLASPLGPEGSRWLDALKKAMDAALHPEPDFALRAALMELRKAEPASDARPEIFRADPPGMLSVDIAGYLSDRGAEFPVGILDCALDEPARTLRSETILQAQVRKPKVRPLATWFEAHHTKTATALMDEAGPVGLLTLPRGKRKSNITTEEAELINALAKRLAGLLSVTASLLRSRNREVGFQKEAKDSALQVQNLALQLKQQQKQDHSEAQMRVEILRAAAHSPAAQVTLQALESHASSSQVFLRAPLGVDPIPWAAHLHLFREPTPRPLVIVDCSERIYRTTAPWALDDESAPWIRAASGTLVLVHPNSLPANAQVRLFEALQSHAPPLVIFCHGTSELLEPEVLRLFPGPSVQLPTLSERSEDLQALIINELAQIGLAQQNSPFGIDPPALYRLIQRAYPGNDAELRGILIAVSSQAEGARIALKDVEKFTDDLQETPPPPLASDRRRERLAPRARRR